MDPSGANAWSQPENGFDNMAAIGEQDFANLVDLDFNSFDFLNFDANGDNSAKIQNDIDLALLSEPAAPSHALQQPQQNGANEHSHAQNPDMQLFNMPMGYEQQHDQAYAMSSGPHAMHEYSMVPPTPNSIEMHGDAARYVRHLEAQNRALAEQQYHIRKENHVCWNFKLVRKLNTDTGRQLSPPWARQPLHHTTRSSMSRPNLPSQAHTSAPSPPRRWKANAKTIT